MIIASQIIIITSMFSHSEPDEYSQQPIDEDVFSDIQDEEDEDGEQDYEDYQDPQDDDQDYDDEEYEDENQEECKKDDQDDYKDDHPSTSEQHSLTPKKEI